MRVLITGISGFVGARLAKRLSSRGDYELFGFSRNAPRDLPAGVVWRSVDLADRTSIIEFIRELKPERVFHLAALAHPRECSSGPEQAFASQVSGTAAVLSALPENARALVVSTSQVYGSGHVSPIPETAELLPENPYGRSKRAAEEVARQAAESGRQVVIARAFNHSGAGQESRYVLPAFAGRVLKARQSGGPIRTGNLFPRRDFLHVDDVLNAYELLLEKGESGRAYNVARGRGSSIEELLVGLQKIAETQLEVLQEQDRMRADDPAEIFGDASALRRLGWEPRISEEQLLREVFESVSADLNLSAS